MYKIKKNAKYLIACSGGPDSMALLDITRCNKNYIEVAHVNHQKRETAKRDENIVRAYCRKYKIPFHLYNLPHNDSGNFQAYARIERYKFFNKLCKKKNLDAVLIAHHKDDLIETYLMQTNKKIGVTYYGLAQENILYGVKVIRPLLNCTKNDLIDYCNKNNIKYGIDESNLTNNYERNRVRHDLVENMTSAQKNKIIKEINIKNKKLLYDQKNVLSIFNKKNDFAIDEFLNIPNIKLALRHFFKGKSDKFFDEMLRQIKYSKSYLYKGLDYWISKEYDRVYIFETPHSYEYHFDNFKQLKPFKYDYFEISKCGNNFYGVTISKNDFPITIRNFKSGDSIVLPYGTKKINRFFIDNKILCKDRLTWPIVVNKKNSAILVPGIGCEINHYSNNHNLYVLK